MTRDSQRCLFWTGTDDAPGFESEVAMPDGLVVCEADATDIVRVRSGAVDGYQGHALWQAGHVPMCSPHATYLADGAPIEWELLDVGADEERIEEVASRCDPEWVPSVDVSLEDTDDTIGGYSIPFDYTTGIKVRRSGLLRGSTGTGRDRRTVNHLVVKEDFQDGRLSRDANTFLCEPNSSLVQVEDGEHDIPREVTCSKCLDLMERWEDD